MHGHHGWGHHCGGGWGGGFGWFFPALILGRVLSDAFDRPQPQGWPYPPPPTPPPQPFGSAQDKPQARPADSAPAAATTGAKAVLRCQNCDQTVSAEFAFCPHCGKRLAPPTCRYCGQTLKPEMAYCAHCGGPVK